MSTLQSQLDQVLALGNHATPSPWNAEERYIANRDYECDCDAEYPAWDIGEIYLEGNRTFVIAAVNFLRQHGPAIRAAVGGEAVAEISISDRSIDLHRRRRQESELGNDAALRAYLGDGVHKLYASPPATVDVGAFDRLREKWISTTNNTFILRSDRDYIEGYDEALKTCAKELAALIGEKA